MVVAEMEMGAGYVREGLGYALSVTLQRVTWGRSRRGLYGWSPVSWPQAMAGPRPRPCPHRPVLRTIPAVDRGRARSCWEGLDL